MLQNVEYYINMMTEHPSSVRPIVVKMHNILLFLFSIKNYNRNKVSTITFRSS